MKFQALFLTLLVVLALVNGKSSNVNHNVIVIGKKLPATTETPVADASAAN